MLQYIYFVKCPNCEDEPFDFFDEAKEFACSCMSKKPIITQVEVDRNDFGECVNSFDLGTIWSWEDAMKETDAEPAISVFTKDDLKGYCPDCDPEFDNLDNSLDFELDDVPDNFKKPITESYATKEFEIPNFDAEIIDEFEDEGIKGYNIVYSKNGTDIVEVEVWETDSPVAVNRDLHTPNLMQGYYSSFDAFASDLEYKTSKYVRVRESTDKKPIPEGMTIEQLVEEMEENEDTVECTWCNDLFDKDQCRKEVNLGYLCSRCEAAIKSRGEKLTFEENNYWDFLDESLEELTLSDMVSDSIRHLVNDLGKDPNAEDFTDLVILDIEKHSDDVPEDPAVYGRWASEIACEVSRQLNNQGELNESADETIYNGQDSVELYYEDLDFEYSVTKNEILEVISIRELVTDEDVRVLSAGRFNSLQKMFEYDEADESAYKQGSNGKYCDYPTYDRFLESNFDALFEKYEDIILKHFRADAEEAGGFNDDGTTFDDLYPSPYEDARLYW